MERELNYVLLPWDNQPQKVEDFIHTHACYDFNWRCFADYFYELSKRELTKKPIK